MAPHKYEDVILDISGKIGTIRLNRPSSLNAFGGNLMLDIIAALRELNENPETVFTVITGEGRFVSLLTWSIYSPPELVKTAYGRRR